MPARRSTSTTLRAKGIVPKLVETIKILGEGELTKKLTIKAQGASADRASEGRGGGRHDRDRRDQVAAAA